MKKLVLILILSLFSYEPTESVTSTGGCLDIDIILLVDLSGSVDIKKDFIVDALNAFVGRFELSETTMRMGMVSFNSEPHVFSNLTGDVNQLKEAFNEIKSSYCRGETNIYSGLIASTNQFREFKRENINKMIILISDGAASMFRKETLDFAEELKGIYGIKICGVYVRSDDGEPDYLTTLCSADCFVLSDYESLREALERLNICL